MGFRGEFQFHNGLTVPNNITSFGRLELLRMALTGNTRATVAAGANLYVGICAGIAADGLQLENIAEPTIGTNGYARIAVSRDGTGWPTDGFTNNEAWIKSKDLVWTATGAGFNKPMTRLFLCTSLNAVTGNLIALSAALPAPLTILSTTPLVDRTFNYLVGNR